MSMLNLQRLPTLTLELSRGSWLLFQPLPIVPMYSSRCVHALKQLFSRPSIMAERTRPRVLVSNDDGITAPGLQALCTALVKADFCDILVCAPTSERSAQSHAITLGRCVPLGADGGWDRACLPRWQRRA